MKQVEDLTGRAFGFLEVVERAPSRRDAGGHIRHFWRCRCSCGGSIVALGQKLRNGKTRSCGCTRGGPRRPLGHAARDLIAKRYAKDAARRGIVFELDDEGLDVLFQGSCFYCGIAPSTTTRFPSVHGQFTYNGIDRVDNGGGYVLGNVVSCCSECNWRKGASSGDEFLAWIRRVSTYRPAAA